ncbi:MAG: AraC family transcriptional regulator [Ignavibacteriae bacterium]|nr:AraC family transcriptional regulator [Ignavibacteriota bacterium]
MNVKNLQRKEYLQRINKVLDYIDNNLDSKFSLDELSSVANFSKFHFHRIFKSILGETLNNYILRIRLEKAATILINNPNLSITEIGFECGFSSTSIFARAFKERFKITATEWRNKYSKEFSKISQTVSNQSEVSNFLNEYFGDVFINKTELKMNHQIGEVTPTKVEVKEISSFIVAYIRYIGPYKGNAELFGNLFGRLFNWAGPRNLCLPTSKVLAVYHDNPEITDEEKLRLSVCISVPNNTEVTDEIGKMEIAGGKYVVASFELTENDYQKAWDYVYSEWFPSSRYQPNDNPCFELYLNDPKEHSEGKHIVDIYVPVKPL